MSSTKSENGKMEEFNTNASERVVKVMLPTYKMEPDLDKKYVCVSEESSRSRPLHARAAGVSLTVSFSVSAHLPFFVQIPAQRSENDRIEDIESRTSRSDVLGYDGDGYVLDIGRYNQASRSRYVRKE